MFHVENPSDFNAGDPNGNRTRVFAVKGNLPSESTALPTSGGSVRANGSHRRLAVWETSGDAGDRGMTQELIERLDELAEFSEAAKGDHRRGVHPNTAARAFAEAKSALQSQSARIAELEGENADLRARCEVVKITVDHKPFTALRHTCGFRIMALVNNTNDYHLAREIMGGAQAEDIDDLHMPLTVNEGDSFVTFPTARFG